MMKILNIKKRKPRKPRIGINDAIEQKKASHKTGLPPGSAVYIGKTTLTPVNISLMQYNATFWEEKKVVDYEHIIINENTDFVYWIDIEGLHDTKLMEYIRTQFDFSSLMLEDIVNTEQRSKIEEFNHHLLFILKNITFPHTGEHIETEQISIVLGKNYVISFREHANMIFEPIANRLRNALGKIRSRGADYLVYSLIDVVVDNNFAIIERTSTDIEWMEDEIFENPSDDDLIHIQQYKRNLLVMKKSVSPLRDALWILKKEECDLVCQQTLTYISDIQDHLTRQLENIDALQEINLGLKDMYLSSLSHRTNQVMQVLTIISTIFIPLTFIVGLYGMNFKVMPELEWKYGYFAVLTVMFIISIFLIIFFRRKNWL